MLKHIVTLILAASSRSGESERIFPKQIDSQQLFCEESDS